jgi:hypothetical protein
LDFQVVQKAAKVAGEVEVFGPRLEIEKGVVMVHQSPNRNPATSVLAAGRFV